MMLIPLFLIILIVVAIYKLSDNRNHLNNHSNSAMDILNNKYASGEITEEEYLRKKEILGRR